MSPQSKKRKKKAKGGRRQLRSVPADPIAEVLAEIEPALRGDSVDDAEAAVSTLLGTLAADLEPDELNSIVIKLMERCVRRPSAAALGLLHVLSALAPDDDLRGMAERLIETTPAAAATAPAWASEPDDLHVVRAMWLRDVWGDQASLLTIFERRGETHGVFALLDFNQLGRVQDLTIDSAPDELIEHLRRAEADGDGTAVLEELPPGRARRLLEDGIAVADSLRAGDGAADVDLDADDAEDDYRTFAMLALARCRAMPEPEPAPEPPQFDDRSRAQIVDTFLAEARFGLPVPGEAARQLARAVVDCGCELDSGQPLRVGPGKLAVFLLGYLPHTMILDDSARDALPTVMRAWADWAARCNDLPPAAVADLDGALDEILEDFDAVYDEGASALSARAMIADLAPDAPAELVRATVDRRMFAMPYTGASIGMEDYEHLDPDDEDDLRLLVIGEHPDLQEALDDPDFDADAAGFSPELHVTIDSTVISQLWHDDPPEVWQATQRLRDQGMERWDVIHEIARVCTEQIWHVLHDEESFDLAAYATALNGLGRP